MGARILVDVDTQSDFVDRRGALHVPAAASVPAAIHAELAAAERHGHPIIGSVDSHAFDAWEFEANGGPFAAHCVKGTPGWLRVFCELPARYRFVPMQVVGADVDNLVGEAKQGAGDRVLDASTLALEATRGVGLYFEKEVYSLFRNPAAAPVIEALVAALGGTDNVRFDVMGYCTGGYCVDAAARGLAERGYTVRVLAYATAAIGGADGQATSKAELEEVGVEWVDAP